MAHNLVSVCNKVTNKQTKFIDDTENEGICNEIKKMLFPKFIRYKSNKGATELILGCNNLSVLK